MYGSKRVAVRDLNPHILCALCGGYLIQATTVIECLHSFCRSCIVNFLETSKVCPICDVQVHKTRPLLNIRPDQTLQSLVYKLVPGLFQDEMRRRREFHATLSESDVEDLSLEERGEASLEKEFKPGDDHVSLILQLAFRENKNKQFEIRDRRYLLCPSEVTVKHLKKFIRMKFQLSDMHKIEMYRAREELSDDLMLQDIALIYSWRKEQPMNLCYTIVESRRPKIEVSPKQPSLSNKQLDLVSPIHESPAGKASDLDTKHSALSAQQAMTGPQITAPAVLATPVIKCNGSESTPAPMTSFSTSISTSTLSSSIISVTSSHVIVTEVLPSVSASVSKNVSIDVKSQSKTDSTTTSNLKVFKQPPISLVNFEPKTPITTTDAVSTIASSNCTSKSKPVTARHNASKLMHSVESILKKSPKRAQHKTNSSSLSWTPVSDVQLSNSSNVSVEKQDITTSKTTKHCQAEHLSGEASKPPGDCVVLRPSEDYVTSRTSGDCGASRTAGDCVVARTAGDCLSKSYECGSQVTAGVKRSQSVIETVNSITDNALKPAVDVSNNHANLRDGLVHADDAGDVFSSYIPKLQKHLKLCAVKRSVSCEGPTLTPVLGPITCGDAMEKRNWKKRKLSTLDFDTSDVSAAESNTLSGCNRISTPKSRDDHQQQETLPQNPISSQKLTVFEDTVAGKAQNVQQGDYTVTPLEKPQSKCSSSDAKVKSCSRKTNGSLNRTSSTTKNNNRMSCESRYNDSVQLSKVDKSKGVSNKKQQTRVADFESAPVSAFVVSKKSLGYIQTTPAKPVNSKCGSTLGEVSTNSSSVEEICVDISSSPSDVSNVTSPTTYVTSPGTEDRTDSSTLPDIQTSCDNNCVVTFSGKVVPLDLSVKKKK